MLSDLFRPPAALSLTVALFVQFPSLFCHFSCDVHIWGEVGIRVPTEVVVCLVAFEGESFWVKIIDIWNTAFFWSQSEFPGRGYLWRLFSCPCWKGEHQDTAEKDADIYESLCQAGWTQAGSVCQPCNNISWLVGPSRRLSNGNIC